MNYGIKGKRYSFFVFLFVFFWGVKNFDLDLRFREVKSTIAVVVHRKNI